jgi:hypothetical protein
MEMINTSLVSSFGNETEPEENPPLYFNDVGLVAQSMRTYLPHQEALA